MIASPGREALTGFLLALPMLLLVPIIVFEVRPVEAVLKSVLTSDGDRPNAAGFAFMLFGLLALPASLVVSLSPMLRKDANGKRRIYLVNLILASVTVALMVPTWGALVDEIYRCDVLRIPNCD